MRLDPEDPLAFVTGLQFVEEGEVNLNQNPVTIEAPLDTTFNRFQNQDVQGTFLFATEDESVDIRRDFPQFNEEGIAFYAYRAGSGIADPFYRFQNSQQPGTYIFVTEQERQNILTSFPKFVEEGIAFEATAIV